MSDLNKAFLHNTKRRPINQGLGMLEECKENQESAELDSQTRLNMSLPIRIPQDCYAESETIWEQQSTTISSLFEHCDDYIVSDNSQVTLRTYYTPPKLPTGPVLFCLHGAGSSSMTFASLLSEVRASDDSIGYFCYDLRGHGDSSATSDYSMDEFVSDTLLVLKTLCTRNNLSQNAIYFMGHSLGGSILSSFLNSVVTTDINTNMSGFILLDIVQETAVKSLRVMSDFIVQRPERFMSVSVAINWHMNFLLFNRESAQLSVPHLLKRLTLEWKTDLAKMQPFWNDWFKYLSRDFLSFKKPKILILSTHDALDKNLIIGQMQGRYQLVVFNHFHSVGHFVQEDLPRQVCISVLDFIKRNHSPQKIMGGELGIIPKWGGSIKM